MGYGDRWNWDRVHWSAHSANCIANCPYRIYTRNGEVVWEEQSGTLPGIDGIPDMNPLGCQKGAAWHDQISGGDRILHPLKRAGERGEGSWEQVSWEDALTTVADAIIDAIEFSGPQSVVIEEGSNAGMLTRLAKVRFAAAMGAACPEGNGAVSDVHLGQWLTLGTVLGGSGADDTFRSDVIIIWNGNPAFTRIPYFHFLTEARYRGATVVLIGPDYSPSAIHTDHFIGIVPGSDAALGLALCRVLIDEGLIDEGFIRSQTDLPLLVKTSDGRFLRQSEMQEGGRDDRFYVWHDDALVPCEPGDLGRPADPQLEGRFRVSLADGTDEEVTPVFTLLRERLTDYSPEAAAEVCGVHPDTIRQLARLVASGRTKLHNGLGSCKHYHGDLMERSMLLLLALTGNWGRPGTGLDTYIIGVLDGELFSFLKQQAGAEGGEQALATVDAVLDGLRASDPAASEAQAALEVGKLTSRWTPMTPPAFYLYYHCGLAKTWERPDYGASPRPFNEYVKEAIAEGWWDGLIRPGPDVKPRVVIQAAQNTLRHTRGGQRTMLRQLWPTLDLVVVLDWRLNTTGLQADVVLPASCAAERVEIQLATSHAWERTFSDRALEPAGESKSDWQIFGALASAIARRAAERGLVDYADPMGMRRSYADIPSRYTLDGAIESDEAAIDEILRDSTLGGNLPAGTSLSSVRRQGYVVPARLPRLVAAMSGSNIEPGEPFVALRHHVEDLTPYGTLTGRAQFYIDHPWFLEADEQLPRHKPVPPMGGDHPLRLTGGHPRWSIHSTNTTNRHILGTTRGTPTVHINPGDAAARGIADGHRVRVFNDLGSCSPAARLSPAVRPGQVILYASWEPYLYPEWRDVTCVEPGMVKWLHFAGGYGHLTYLPNQWQPTQSDRLFRVDVEPCTGSPGD
ncbi:MAG: Dimethylsulfide dehydrogenase subunit alpha [Acidimicrobiales bacterium]|nr:MAG: hypothetical protein EDR02_13045 [Actinomycetota bacterium]MBV6509388.1 Dimethylsulfide dehydrogenase subunit alpha [Acidimicrobiales bacterium]RIK04581.1 MAG: hypothetical protein DCC48_12780 [Acidobacteriota bacterium]